MKKKSSALPAAGAEPSATCAYCVTRTRGRWPKGKPDKSTNLTRLVRQLIAWKPARQAAYDAIDELYSAFHAMRTKPPPTRPAVCRAAAVDTAAVAAALADAPAAAPPVISRLRAPPPEVPAKLKRSDFADSSQFEQYRKKRRAAQMAAQETQRARVSS